MTTPRIFFSSIDALLLCILKGGEGGECREGGESREGGDGGD